MEERAGGRRTARERVDLLLDEGTFVELDRLTRADESGVIIGMGAVDGRPVCVFSQQPADDGHLGERSADKIIAIIDAAARNGCPLIGLLDGGALEPTAADALASSGEIVRRQARLSGVVPQLLVIMGDAARGGLRLLPTLSDFVIMVDQAARLSASTEEVITTVTGEEVGPDELSSAGFHASTSGTAHVLADDDEDALGWVREVLSYLPQSNLDEPPTDDSPDLEPSAGGGIPAGGVLDSRSAPYDVREVIERVLDAGGLCEVHRLFAPNLVVGFGRIDGRSVGVLANQPLHLAGFLDGDAVEKAARFVRCCDAFNLPVITFVDVPGFLPDLEQERSGLLRRSAKLAYAYAEATVPLLTVVLGKAYGDAATLMGSRFLGVDATLAWPTARLAALPAAAAVNARHADELARHDDPEARRAELVRDYDEQVAGPAVAARRGDVDAVIEPAATRDELTRLLRLLRTKRESLPPKKHGNIPL